jgi:hypothetical protein
MLKDITHLQSSAEDTLDHTPMFFRLPLASDKQALDKLLAEKKVSFYTQRDIRPATRTY